MSINAFIFLMFCKIKDTELSFIIEHIKVLIFNIIMNKFRQYLLFTMCIGTKLSIRTVWYWIRPMCAETFSIRLRVILFFYRRMTIHTIISWWTFLPFLNKWTHISWIEISYSSSIFLIMIIYAHFMIMLDCNIARIDFKNIKI